MPWCNPAISNFGLASVFSAAFTFGWPHTKMNVLRMIHGSQAAVAAQDALPYTEPPFWYYPTRQSLGFALMKAGKAKEAQAVYEADLKQYMHNGWSTFGLIQALDAQGKKADADMLREHFKAMWQFADIEMKGSRVSGSPT